MSVILVKPTKLNNIVISICKGEHITKKEEGIANQQSRLKKTACQRFHQKIMGQRNSLFKEKVNAHSLGCQSRYHKVVENVQSWSKLFCQQSF